jgi:DNA-binding transcriptional MerR regulator
MKEGYTATEAAKILGVAQRTVIGWGAKGLVEAGVQKSTGPGSRRVYSAANLVQMALIREAFRRGISKEHVALFYKAFKGKMPDTDIPQIEVVFGVGRQIDEEAVPWIVFVDGTWVYFRAGTSDNRFPFPLSSKNMAKAKSVVGFNLNQLQKEIASKI